MAAASPTTPAHMYPPQAMIIDPQSLPYAYVYAPNYAPDAYGNIPRIEDSSHVVTDLDPDTDVRPQYSQPNPHHAHHHHRQHHHPNHPHHIHPAHHHAHPHPHPHQHQHQQNHNHNYHSSSRTPSDRSESTGSVDESPVRLAIRRHSPGALDPAAQEIPRSQPEPMILPRSPVVSSPYYPAAKSRTPPRSPLVSSPYQPTPRSKTPPRSILRRRRPSPKSETPSDHVPSPSPFRQERPRTPPSSRDPDERPIRPMKDISVYKAPPVAAKKPIQKKKPISPPKAPVQSSPKPPVQSPSVSPRRYEPEPEPVSPSRPRTNNNTAIPRRPVRLDIIPKRVSPIRASVQSQPRPIVVEEYEEEDDDYPPSSRVMPERVIEYRVISHDSPRVRRVIQTQEMPRRRIVYRS